MGVQSNPLVRLWNLVAPYVTSPLGFAVLAGLLVAVGWAHSVIKRAGYSQFSSPTGGLSYVVGPQGSGKSMFGVRRIVAALAAGQYVVTNCRLYAVGDTALPGGWADAVCAKLFPKDYRDPERRALTVAWLTHHYVYETGLRRAMRYRVPCARCGGVISECGHSGPEQEARALFVWDETHNDLSNRDYQGVGNTVEERNRSKEERRLIIRWGTHMRKLGYAGFLLSQHEENTDAQLRRVCNFIVRLQNQRISEGGALARLLPRRWTIFVVATYPAHLADGKGVNVKDATSRERYVLPWTRVLYDSWETFHGLDAADTDDSPIYLPAYARPERDSAGPADKSTRPFLRRGLSSDKAPTLVA